MNKIICDRYTSKGFKSENNHFIFKLEGLEQCEIRVSGNDIDNYSIRVDMQPLSYDQANFFLGVVDVAFALQNHLNEFGIKELHDNEDGFTMRGHFVNYAK